MGTLIENSQIRLQKSLKANADFNISLKETQKILEKFLGFKIKLVILNIDLMGSTKMSLDLPMDKLTTIIRSFAQEFSIIISNYGGYVLKYIGDAVLAFFVFEDSLNKNKKNTMKIDLDDDKDVLSFQYDNVIECAKTMIRVIQKGMNPILNKYGYPELKVRIGIDYGEIAIVKYGMDIDEINEKPIKRIHLDMIGYTISLAVKMTSLAYPDHLVIGQSIYDRLDKKQKEGFKQRQQTTGQDFWKYIKESTGKNYLLYQNLI